MVTFPDVVVNSAAAYNPTTGYYTCLATGYYFFSISVAAFYSYYQATSITLQGANIDVSLSNQNDFFSIRPITRRRRRFQHLSAVRAVLKSQ